MVIITNFTHIDGFDWKCIAVWFVGFGKFFKFLVASSTCVYVHLPLKKTELCTFKETTSASPVKSTFTVCWQTFPSEWSPACFRGSQDGGMHWSGFTPLSVRYHRRTHTLLLSACQTYYCKRFWNLVHATEAIDLLKGEFENEPRWIGGIGIRASIGGT